MKVYESVVAGTLAVGLFAGCTATPEGSPKPSHEVSVEEVKTDITQAYNEAESFWEGQGIRVTPSLALPENQTIACGATAVSPTQGSEVLAAACFTNQTLIVWPIPLAEQVNKVVEQGAVARTVVALAVKHEYAHFVQEKMNVLSHPELRGIVEPQADCMAGAAMRHSNPDAQPSVQIYYNSIDAQLGRPDSKHGSAPQRLASFALGYTPQPGKNCDNVVPLAN